MAIVAGDYVELDVIQSYEGQTVINSFAYLVTVNAVTVSALNIAEGWWNAVKTNWRAGIVGGFGNWFTSIKIRSLMSTTGDYGEWSIPAGERIGTRTAPASSSAGPFLAYGVRLTVGSRLTRPGQKRFSGLFQADCPDAVLQASYKAIMEPFVSQLDDILTLGAPALGTVMQPSVVRKDNLGVFVLGQPITGHVGGINATTQNTRKVGRGI